MKKMLFISILVLMLIGLVACGGNQEAAPGADPTTQPAGGNSAPYQDSQGPTDMLPTGEEPTLPEIELDWEPAAPSGSFDTTEPTTEEPAPEQTGGSNTGNTDKTEQPTEKETSPAERDGVTGNFTPWG